MTLTDEQRQAILDEIVAVTEPPKRQEYQFTRREYQEHTGVTQAQAQGRLESAVKSGTLLRERVFIGGKRPWVYWRPEDDPIYESQQPHE